VKVEKFYKYLNNKGFNIIINSFPGAVFLSERIIFPIREIHKENSRILTSETDVDNSSFDDNYIL